MFFRILTLEFLSFNSFFQPYWKFDLFLDYLFITFSLQNFIVNVDLVCFA